MSEQWYKNRVEVNDGQEVVYEIITAEDGIGLGTAIADIKSSAAHWHATTKETYTLVSGVLEIWIGTERHVLDVPGQSLAIPTDIAHWANSLDDKSARVLVTSVPAWTPEDHHLVKD